MGVRRRIVGLIRRALGIDTALDRVLIRRFDPLALEVKHISRRLSEVEDLLWKINHVANATFETNAEQRGLLLDINHASLQLHEIAPRVAALDDVRHLLVYSEAIASDHARSAALDAESVAVLLRSIERLLAPLIHQTASRKESEQKPL